MDEQTHQPASTGTGSALHVLDRVFLSADDAARYAHERVGRRRDRGYYGYILQRNDRRFVVTEPAEQPVRVVSHHQVIPDNHVLHSRFYSHPALSTLDAGKVAQLKWSVEDAATSLLMFSVEELRNTLGTHFSAYLSGAEDSLISFTPDLSRWANLLVLLGSTNKPGGFALGLAAGAAKPEQLVMEAAAAGDLQVLISNGRWRPRGKITGERIPGPWERTVPERVSFGAVFPSADEAALDRYSKDTGHHDEEQTWFGFILKQQGREEYVATELVPVGGVRDKLYSLRSLFSESRTTDSIFPESLLPYAYFYSRQRVKHARDEPRRWLAQHFIVPRDLYVVVYNSKRRPVMEGNAPIPLYVSTQDGALLKYVARKGTKLFDNDVPNMGLEVIQSNLASRKLSTTDFVRVVAKSGALSVMRTSLCWDRKGPVDIYWTPSRNLERRTLGPVFLTVDDAAVHARSKLPAGRRSAFGGLILMRADGLFVATDPVDIPQEDFTDEAIVSGNFPADCTIVARYRSRVPRAVSVVLSTVDKSIYLNMLSVEVIYAAFTRVGRTLNEFLFAPDGSIIRYRTGLWERLRADLATALSASGKPAPEFNAAWIKEQIYQGFLSPTDWVKKLVKSGNLQVVVGSRLWGQARAVTDFAPFPAVVSTSGHVKTASDPDPACSPVCVREQDAARLAHEQAGSRLATRFGFVVWNASDGSFVASLPVELQGSALAYDRIFPGTLPYRYVLSATYLCAAQVPQNLPDDDYRHFISPKDVSLARVSVRTPQGYRPIYFSCADGALLRYELNAFDPVVYRDKYGQFEVRDNPFATFEQARLDWDAISRGTFSLGNYIRRMVAAGKLEVLVTSAYWSCPGPVGADWRPRMPAVSIDKRWAERPVFALGPMFHHPDDAARYAHDRAVQVDSPRGVSASAVLSKSRTYSYVSLEPLADPGSSHEARLMIFRSARSQSPPWSSSSLPTFPDGYKLIASHQIAKRGSVTQTGLSAPDFANGVQLFLNTHVLNGVGFDIEAYYYSTGQGALLKYVPTFSNAEKSLLITDLPDSDQMTGYEAFISRLAETGVLKVLQAANDWKQAGRLGRSWRVTRQEAPEISDKPTRDEL